jgi:hypothetical protein
MPTKTELTLLEQQQQPADPGHQWGATIHQAKSEAVVLPVRDISEITAKEEQAA